MFLKLLFADENILATALLFKTDHVGENHFRVRLFTIASAVRSWRFGWKSGYLDRYPTLNTGALLT